MNKQGMLVVISAPSGCGKDTVAKALCKLRDDCYISVSATTREKRKGEIEGVDYFFKTREEFEKLIESNGLLEYASFAGNYYGTPVEEVRKSISQGKICLLIIEVQGAKNIMKMYKDCVPIFLLPPSFEILEKRLRGRKTDTEEVINERLRIAKHEINSKEKYKYTVVNDDLDEAVKEISEILDKELIKHNS